MTPDLRADAGSGADAEMTGDAGLPRHHDLILQHGRTGNPNLATRTQARPIWTLCPICTRLSIRVPAPMTVSSKVPRSIVVLAPTSTSLSITTRPSCGTVWNPSGRDSEAEPILSDPDARVDIDPVADQRMGDARRAVQCGPRGR